MKNRYSQLAVVRVKSALSIERLITSSSDRTFQAIKDKENLLIYWPVQNRNSNSSVNRIQREICIG